MILILCFFCYMYADNLNLHILTHSFPTRRSSDLFLAPLTIRPTTRRITKRSSHPARMLTTMTSTTLSARNPTWIDRSASHGQKTGSVTGGGRLEEHKSELQSLMRISYAVLCLKKKTYNNKKT